MYLGVTEARSGSDGGGHSEFRWKKEAFEPHAKDFRFERVLRSLVNKAHCIPVEFLSKQPANTLTETTRHGIALN